MNTQEYVDHNIRQTLGDLMLQLIMHRARIAELEAAAAEPPAEPVLRPNGKGKEAGAMQ